MRRRRHVLRKPLLLFALLLLGPALGFSLLGWNSVVQEHEFRLRDMEREKRSSLWARKPVVARIPREGKCWGFNGLAARPQEPASPWARTQRPTELHAAVLQASARRTRQPACRMVIRTTNGPYRTSTISGSRL